MSMPSASPLQAVKGIQSKRSDSVGSMSSSTSSTSSSNQLHPPVDPHTYLKSHDDNPVMAIKHLLSEKHSLSSQNSQLWRLIEKQRLIIHNLQRDCQKLANERTAILAKTPVTSTFPESPRIPTSPMLSSPLQKPTLMIPVTTTPSSNTSSETSSSGTDIQVNFSSSLSFESGTQDDDPEREEAQSEKPGIITNYNLPVDPVMEALTTASFTLAKDIVVKNGGNFGHLETSRNAINNHSPNNIINNDMRSSSLPQESSLHHPSRRLSYPSPTPKIQPTAFSGNWSPVKERVNASSTIQQLKSLDPPAIITSSPTTIDPFSTPDSQTPTRTMTPADGSIRSSSPMPSPKPLQREFSSPSKYSAYDLTPDMLPFISINVPASKIKTNEKGKEVSFLICVSHAGTNPALPVLPNLSNLPSHDIGNHVNDSDMWCIEKLYSDFIHLDSKLRSHTKSGKLPKIPDKNLFRDNAPSKVDQRKLAIEQYLQQLISATFIDLTDLCTFLTTNVVVVDESQYSTSHAGYKEGYLTKRGKNFGGWKTRYFMLQSPVLEYFESKGGAHLGSIRLENAQIGRQSSNNAKEKNGDNDSSYRHAFLILERKGKDSKDGSNVSRHVLCAESDRERDLWIQALLRHVVAADREGMKRANNLSNQPKEKSLRRPSNDQDTIGLRYDDTIKGQSPSSDNASSHNLNELVISPPMNGVTINDPRMFSGFLATVGANGYEQEDKKKATGGIKGFWTNLGSSSSGRYNNLTDEVFGVPLQDAIATAPAPINRPLPAVIYRCIEYLEAKDSASEEGIFRLSGSSSTIKALKDRFNNEGDIDLLAKKEQYYDVHAVAGLLKLYLRELPVSVLTRELHSQFLGVIDIHDRKNRVMELGQLVRELPTENYTLLKALSAHLLMIIQKSSVNKMTIRNVGIVFSPTLGIPAGVFSLFLTEFEYIFWNGEGEMPTISEDGGAFATLTLEKKKPYIPADMPTSAAYTMHEQAKPIEGFNMTTTTVASTVANSGTLTMTHEEKEINSKNGYVHENQNYEKILSGEEISTQLPEQGSDPPPYTYAMKFSSQQDISMSYQQYEYHESTQDSSPPLPNIPTILSIPPSVPSSPLGPQIIPEIEPSQSIAEMLANDANLGNGPVFISTAAFGGPKAEQRYDRRGNPTKVVT